MSDKYIDRLLSGRATISQFPDYVADWHADPDTNEEVYEYLGLSWPEYQLVALDESRLRYVAASRRHNQPLENFSNQDAEGFALAARSGSSRELSELISHLVEKGILVSSS